MSTTLDNRLGVGESQSLDRPWYNDLVDKLKDLSAANRVTIKPSATRAVVHPSPEENYQLAPGLVSIEDQTNWGDTPVGDLRVEWEIVSGPGHLLNSPGGDPTATVTTGANEAVYWSWSNAQDTGFDETYYSGRPERDWSAVVDGASLPGVVHVRATAERLLEDGTYATVSQTSTHVIVERGYDPSVQPGIGANVHPQQDVAYLGSDGTSEVVFEDLTTITGESEVTRTVTAHMKGGDGSNVNLTGAYLDGVGNVVGVPAADLTINAEAKAAGTLVVEIEYDTGSKVTRITRSVVVRPALETQIGATTDPTTPPTQMQPGPGYFTIEGAQPVEVLGLEDQGSVFGESPGMQWTNERSRELAKRLGVSALSDDNPQLDMLYEAGAILVAALHQPTESGLRRYEVDLPRGAARAGHIVRVEGGVIRLKERTEQRDDIDTFTAVGVAETTEGIDAGYVTGNGEVFEVDIELAYGRASQSGFPEESHKRTLLLRPGNSAGTITLPNASPAEVGDRWYVRYQVTSRWTNGKTVSSSWTNWEEADQLPEGAAEATINAEGKTSVLNIVSEGRVQGVTKWARQGGSPISDREVLNSDYLPTTTDTHPAPGIWENASRPPHLFVKLLQVSPAGSSRGQVESFNLQLPEEARQVLPTMPVSGNSIPKDTPVVPGMLVEGATRAWIGLSDKYMSLGTGANISSLLEGVSVQIDNESFAPATKESATRYTRGVPVFEANSISVQLETVGAVDKVEFLGRRQSFLRPRTSPTKQANGQFTQAFMVPQSASGAENRLEYRLVAGDDERIIELVIENTNVTTDTGPELLSIDTLFVTKEMQLATAKGTNPYVDTHINRDALPQEWTLTADESEHTWRGAELVLNASGMKAAELIQATDGAGTALDVSDIKVRVDSRRDPQKAFLNLSIGDLDTVETPEVELQLKSSQDAGAETTNVLIKLRYSGTTPVQAI